MAGVCFCPESPCPTVIKGNNSISGWSNVAPTHADSLKGFYNKRLQGTESLEGKVGSGARRYFHFFKKIYLSISEKERERE